jgi:hypothetical protein
MGRDWIKSPSQISLRASLILTPTDYLLLSLKRTIQT